MFRVIYSSSDVHKDTIDMEPRLDIIRCYDRGLSALPGGCRRGKSGGLGVVSVSCVIPGTRDVKQMRENTSAAEPAEG